MELLHNNTDRGTLWCSWTAYPASPLRIVLSRTWEFYGSSGAAMARNTRTAHSSNSIQPRDPPRVHSNLYAAAKRSSRDRNFKGIQVGTCGAFRSCKDQPGHPPPGRKRFHGHSDNKYMDGVAALSLGLCQSTGSIGQRRAAFPSWSIYGSCPPLSLLQFFQPAYHQYPITARPIRGTPLFFLTSWAWLQ